MNRANVIVFRFLKHRLTKQELFGKLRTKDNGNREPGLLAQLSNADVILLMGDDRIQKIRSACAKLDRGDRPSPEELKILAEEGNKLFTAVDYERADKEARAFMDGRRKLALRQQKRLQKQWVPDTVREAIESDDVLVHCIKAPTGSGKTFSIKKEVCKREDTAFTIFVKSHMQIDEYEKDIRTFGGKAYHHRGIGGRKECPPDLIENMRHAFARGLKHVHHICKVCKYAHNCPTHNQKPSERFEPFTTDRIVLAPHNLFPYVARTCREWKSGGVSRARVFVVDENYFDTLRLPRYCSRAELGSFLEELWNFCDHENISFPEIEELNLLIANVGVKLNERFAVIPPVKPDYRITGKVWRKWYRYFEKWNKMGTVRDLLAELEGGVRNGVLVTNPRHKVPGTERRYKFTFKVDNLRLPGLKNKLIITDATFKKGSEAWLAKMLRIPQKQIKVHTNEEKPITLVVDHYPFCNASKGSASQNLPKVKAWIDYVITEHRESAEAVLYWSSKIGEVTSDSKPNRKRKTTRRTKQIWTKKRPLNICIVSYKRYQVYSNQGKRDGKSVGEDIRSHIEGKYSYVKPVFFYYGNESGFDSEDAKNSQMVLVIGKFQMPSNLIQALFLNTGHDLGYDMKKENVVFDDPRLQEEFDYYTFRSSYQGASRARFFRDIDIPVHILSTEDIPNTWRDVLDVKNSYLPWKLSDLPELKVEFSKSKLLGRMIDVAKKTLQGEGYCCRKEIWHGTRDKKGNCIYGCAGSRESVDEHWEVIKSYLSDMAYPYKGKYGAECLRLVRGEDK